MQDSKILQVVLPKNNEWTFDDLDKSAEARGMSRSKLMFEAIDLMYHLEPAFVDQMKESAARSGVTPAIYLQNTIIRAKALEDAHNKAWGRKSIIRFEFMAVERNGKQETLTGKELYKTLFDYYYREEMQKRAIVEARRKALTEDPTPAWESRQETLDDPGDDWAT